jgi:hypothetical protein
MAKTSEAQQRATAKWQAENKERRLYLTKKSTTKNFILKHSTVDDLKNVAEWLEQRNRAENLRD